MEASYLKDLYVAALKKMENAERQIAGAENDERPITGALTTMSKNTSNQALRSAFDTHREESLTQQKRLQDILNSLNEPHMQGDSEVMQALVEQGERVISANADESVRDAALLAIAQQVEHFEIASYGALCTYAETLGRMEDVKQLRASLDEEKSADAKLNVLAKDVVNPNQ